MSLALRAGNLNALSFSDLSYNILIKARQIAHGGRGIGSFSVSKLLHRKISVLFLKQIFASPGVTLSKSPILSERGLRTCRMEKL